MKRRLICAMALALLLVGCSGETVPSGSVTDSANQMQTVEDLLEEAGAQRGEAPVELPPESVPSVTVEAVDQNIPTGFGSYGSVDIDLTAMSSVMVYTQVYTMITNPDDYVGKTIKMHGDFGFYSEASVDTYYFGIVVQDATACCAQGIEFTLADEGERIFPDDYPELGAATTVVGVFNTYFPEETPDWEYYRLEQAEFITE